MHSNNLLLDVVKNHTGNSIKKWEHYFEIYQKYFENYINKSVNIMEIGVLHGGSLQVWKKYFGKNANIYGIDINPECKNLEEENITIQIGDQSDIDFLKRIKQQTPKMDIIIDDGGHMMNQQINTFIELFPHIKEQGYYVCEDLNTSYWKSYGGGYKRKGTFIEYSKNIIDNINAWYSEEKNKFNINYYTEHIFSIHYFPGIVLIEKKKMNEPHHIEFGNKIVNPILGMPNHNLSGLTKIMKKFKSLIKRYI